MKHIQLFEDFINEANETGWENASDDQLKAKFKDYEKRKHDLGAQASKDFLDLQKEMSKRNLDESAIQEAAETKKDHEVAVKLVAKLIKENPEMYKHLQTELPPNYGTADVDALT